ncbi:hypothetical protein EC973_004077 [Apophysomyces ossiformis]|uniref:6-phosphofructo-2-kinase domain-containing protein n=1 Tax=Apophysomyces ossiformis TaxID=679940 RepID=A0A8H7BLR7_9FUNG|nr:hypothetical protein EC973_004077 [Apophysomyces ossiformis]
MSVEQRRKTLPVVKDIEQLGTLTLDDSLPVISTSPPSSSPPTLSPSVIPQPNHWLQLSADVENDWALRSRQSFGLDIPGAVHTIIPQKLKNERPLDNKLVIIMVGLPARGKSYLVKKLRRYLNWLQYETKIFNVGNVRRDKEAAQHDQSAQFFDPDNREMKKIRDRLALTVLDQLIDWLKEGGGNIAIHDATNSTIERRKLLIDRLKKEPEIRVLLLESMLERNFRLKLAGPDYVNKNSDEALADFRSRVANYERAYQPLGEWEEENDIQYCKLINVGKKVIAYNISGYLSGQCVFYLMNFNLIFVTRHGESTDNVAGRIGGDASLSERGERYARALARFVQEQRANFANDLAGRKKEDPEETKTTTTATGSQFTVWTSMLKRAVQTGDAFDPDEYDIKNIRFLNEINAGMCEGMTYEEIQQQYPSEFQARQENKLYYRYPGMGGESYIDVIHRLQSMIIELERMTQSCLIITHRVVMRILLGYMLDWHRTEMPHMMVPIHTVYEIRPMPYGTELKKWRYIEDTDTFEEF